MTFNRIPAFVVLTIPACAHACGICNANLSYNFFPFTAAWMIIFLGWLAVLGGVYAAEKLRGRNVTQLRSALNAALKYLGLLLVLYLFGLHLVAILALPVLLFINRRRFKNDPSRLSWITTGALAALIVLVPVSYFLFPKVASEPETRVMTNRFKSEVGGLLTAGGLDISKIPADPFAYTMFDVPVLNVMAQSSGTFYKGLSQPENNARVIKSEEQILIWSRGPDGEFSFSEAELVDSKSSVTTIAAISYDPTNGMLSRGDLLIVEKR